MRGWRKHSLTTNTLATKEGPTYPLSVQDLTCGFKGGMTKRDARRRNSIAWMHWQGPRETQENSMCRIRRIIYVQITSPVQNPSVDQKKHPSHARSCRNARLLRTPCISVQSLLLEVPPCPDARLSLRGGSHDRGGGDARDHGVDYGCGDDALRGH